MLVYFFPYITSCALKVNLPDPRINTYGEKRYIYIDFTQFEMKSYGHCEKSNLQFDLMDKDNNHWISEKFCNKYLPKDIYIIDTHTQFSNRIDYVAATLNLEESSKGVTRNAEFIIKFSMSDSLPEDGHHLYLHE